MVMLLSVGNVWAAPTAATLTAGTNGSSVTVNSKAAIKVGTNKKSGDMTITVGAGATTLNLHAVAWSGAAGSIDLSAPSGVTLSQTSLSLSENSNISGSSTNYTIETESDYLFTITLTGVESETVITLTGGTTSGKAKRFVVWEATYETGSTPPTPSKTLESIAVSGAPTKTSYYAGDNFDPAGLTVTGTYSDESTAPITSGITWSYDPSQELALNQTSIGVIATVSEIASPKFNVTGLSVTEAPAAVNYEKVDAEPADWSGEYILVYEADETNARVWKGADAANNYAEATISAGVIAAPEGAAVLTIAKVAESSPVVYTIKVGEKYIGQTSDANGMKIQDAAINNSISYNTTDAAVDIVASSAHLRYNSASSSYFRYYKSATYSGQKKIQLYKKVDGTVKEAAGLSYATADQKKLVKLGDAFTAPTLVNPNNLTVDYASNNTDVAEVAANGAVTIKATGVAVITASSEETDTYKAGSASYTIGVTTHAGTEADPFDVADARNVIDAFGTKEGVYMSGIVSQITTPYDETYHNISFDISADGTPTADQVRAFRCKGLDNTDFTSEDDVKTSATVTVYGNLTKYNSTYEFEAGCYLKAYEAPAVPKTHIANDQAHPYTVAQALEYAADGATYDLDDYVYIQGVVYDVKSFNNGVMNIFIKDANIENQFEFFKCEGINDGSATTPFEALTDVQVGNIVIGYGQMMYYQDDDIYEFKAGNYLVDLQVPATGIELDATAEVEEGSTVNLTATILPSNATGTIVWSVQSGSDYASVAAGVVTGKAEGEAVIRATVEGTAFYAECTVTVTAAAAPDTRKIANGPAAFTTTSGNLTPADIAYTAYQGGASTAPAIYNDGIRLYQISGSNDFGGFVTITAKTGCTIDEVQITTTSKYATTVAYSVDGNENLLKSESVAASSLYTTGTDLNVSSVNILNVGTGSSGRLEIASIKVYYTGEAATIDHYELGGTYQTAFMQDEEFNHTGLIVYAAYDALGENKVDITSMCTFSEPDMSTTGEKTIEITYNEAVVTSYTINVAADSRKVANSPATFTTVSDDMTPNDITFASYQGGAGTAPANYNDGIRLYQAPSADAIGGFITLKAKMGCTIDQVKITTTNTYATTVAYSVDGNENLLSSESVAKSSDYSTPSGLNVESVNIVNKGTGSSGRLEIASIKVWYTGDPLAVDHYILGGTYATEFEQYGEFNYEGLTVTAAYDAGETITEAVVGFTVEADLSTAGNKKADVMLNSVKIAEYDITVTASAKEDPALAYSPASVVLTLGDALSAPTFSNTHNVSPITYSSDKESVATVDAEGNIALAGGCGTAVITASFAGDDDYIDSEATFTITVNEPTEDLSGTWVVAKSVAAGDRIIVGATVSAGTKTMGKQNSNPNRAAVASTLADGVLTPGEGTKTFLVVDAGDGKFALQALNGKYLTSATEGTGNNLLEAASYENDNAKWTITIDGEGVASVVAAAGNRTYMKYNNGSTLFSCYQYETSQSPISIYKKGTPDYGSYQRNVTSGNYGTICLPKAGTIEGATLFEIAYYDETAKKIYLDEVGSTMEAGKPYIFQATATELNVTYTSGTQVAASDANGLYGFYNLSNMATDEADKLDLDEDQGNYILYNNQYWLVSGRAAYINNFRAYIKLDEISTTAPDPTPGQAPRRRVAMTVNGEQVVTGIDALNAAEAPVKVLINGQMYILRGEKMYDATGRLVK